MQELYRQAALKLGRDATEKARDDLQRSAEQRAVAKGATRQPTGRRGSQTVKK